ncbi:MAG: asparagine synthase-related protein [Pseudodesulfovibrio sp.]
MGMDELRSCISGHARGRSPVVVALSGGVDSALVALAARAAAGPGVVAATAGHELVARREFTRAVETAEWIGMEHHPVLLRPLLDPAIRGNGDDRCLACKRALFRTMIMEYGDRCLVLDGTNADDDPARPGLLAVRESGVASPLRECGLTKEAVRALAREAGLPDWDRPSDSCLATRIPRGTPLDAGRLAMVERLESFFHERGVAALRVRPDNLVATVEYLPQYADIMRKYRDDFMAEIKRIGLRSCRFQAWSR